MEVEYVLARKILQLANQIIRNRNEDLKGLGLTAEQADALRFFQGSSNRSAVDLKEHLGISHQAARAIVERMVAKDLLMTKISQTDARYKEVSLTEKGICSFADCSLLACNRIHYIRSAVPLDVFNLYFSQNEYSLPVLPFSCQCRYSYYQNCVYN